MMNFWQLVGSYEDAPEPDLPRQIPTPPAGVLVA